MCNKKHVLNSEKKIVIMWSTV